MSNSSQVSLVSQSQLSDIVGSTSNTLGQRGTMFYGTLSLVPRRKVASSGPTLISSLDNHSRHSPDSYFLFIDFRIKSYLKCIKDKPKVSILGEGFKKACFSSENTFPNLTKPFSNHNEGKNRQHQYPA